MPVDEIILGCIISSFPATGYGTSEYEITIRAYVYGEEIYNPSTLPH